jgi:hypothetical protein
LILRAASCAVYSFKIFSSIFFDIRKTFGCGIRVVRLIMERLSKVFITGGTGFIGTKLVNELVRRGHTVHVLKRPASNMDGLKGEDIRFFEGDLWDSVMYGKWPNHWQWNEWSLLQPLSPAGQQPLAWLRMKENIVPELNVVPIIRRVK